MLYQGWLTPFEGYTVLAENLNNGKDLKSKIQQHIVPDIVLLDVNIPEMDSFRNNTMAAKVSPVKSAGTLYAKTRKQSLKNVPPRRKGYLLKNTDPDELKRLGCYLR